MKMSLRVVVLMLAMTVLVVVEGRADDKATVFVRMNCVACHGEDGAGSRFRATPSIAGLPAWYVLKQLKGFRERLRGMNVLDRKGKQMHEVSLAMDEATMRELAAAIAKMPRVRHAPPLFGNGASGARLYREKCMSCHGERGQGDEAKGAPPLTVFQSWYINEQLKKFQAGERQVDVRDVPLMRMHQAAQRLESSSDQRDLMRYIGTLSREAQGK
jgi:cytochrome c oxidase subunit 2